ncbi:hypothetical protein BGZ60DRAFT_551109, partial [Tricladium varicosporioides]
FFVISGFVLSYKPTKQIRAGQYEALLDTLASSVFRRGLRLYLPVAAGTFLSMLIAYMGWYRELPESSTDALPPNFDNFSDHFWHWRNHMVGISWPFQEVTPNTPYGPPYNGHLWTIPIEYYGSIVVYGMVLGFSRCQALVRLVAFACVAMATLHYERWDLFLFLSGALLAETSLMNVNEEDFDFEYQSEKRKWWSGLLAMYLGDISYALYIVHGPVLFTVGTWFMDTFGQVDGTGPWIIAFTGAALFNTIISVWVADLFWRGVDAKSVDLAKWFAGKCWRKD